ncbi:MAG: hypothetical protein NZ480_08520 [Bdellovibrionaceae bacterium]|nr:hypothetical protein [Pseudobdellovibrionaceae bacterium]MDW8190116.1 hypothetical protein [Pseudobdellovibrionaceae bacterium]
MLKNIRLGLLFSLMVTLVWTGCGSSKKRERSVQREHLSSSRKFYCEFINGEKFSDIDVTLNIQMAERCDTSLPFSISGYRSASDLPGVIFCCNLRGSVAERPVELKGHKSEDSSSDRFAPSAQSTGKKQDNMNMNQSDENNKPGVKKIELPPSANEQKKKSSP